MHPRFMIFSTTSRQLPWVFNTSSSVLIESKQKLHVPITKSMNNNIVQTVVYKTNRKFESCLFRIEFFLNRKCRKQIEVANEMLAYVIPGFRRSVLKHNRNITYGSIKQTLWLLIGFQNEPFGLLMCCIFTSSPLLKLLYAALL